MRVEPTKIAVNFEPALLAALDEHRRKLPDLPSRSEAIRRAVEAVALNGTSTRKPRAKAPRKNGSKNRD